MKIGKTRIRRVRFHDGRTLEVLHNNKSEDYAIITGHVAASTDIMLKHGDIAGFAFVVWDREGGSIVCVKLKDSCTIPGILVPDFVRNRILAEKIQEWTIEKLTQPR